MPGVPAATPNLHVYHPERAFILIQTATPMLVKPRNAKYVERLESYSGNLDLTADGQSIQLHFDISIPICWNAHLSHPTIWVQKKVPELIARGVPNIAPEKCLWKFIRLHNPNQPFMP